MYETMTGKPPFIAKTAETLAAMHREMSPQPPSQLNPAITPELEQIMMKVLAKEPAARYRTADQLGRVLTTFGQTRKSPAVQLTHPAPPPDPGPTLQITPPQPTVFVRRTTYSAPQPEVVAEVDETLDIDWISVGLGLLALMSVGGLMVLWFFIYLRWTNPTL